ncbi:Alpha/beta hydrolase fold-1 [Elsinoe ampelina]|uniref:Alpha/beta hydrolase fold-1 n=1 Tax=Elsinoe ampelina TaxID=302913 RepID=A0A6A6GRT1_9PEZI|nr:Alpha/beta hydrolase fold-1 [Elsinoe ampelina]
MKVHVKPILSLPAKSNPFHFYRAVIQQADTMANPLVWLLVPGAWHPGPMYQPMLNKLAEAGYETHAITNRSVADPRAENITIQDDAQQVHDVITGFIDQGKDVVVITHSYGGLVGTTGAYGLSKKAVEVAGKKGGVVGVVCIASVFSKEGVSVRDAGGAAAGWVNANSPREGVSSVSIEDGMDVFYGPEVDEDTARALAGQIKPQGMQTFTSPPGKSVWADENMKGRLGYIRCLRDRALPFEVQKALLDMTETEWHIADLDTGHSPFVSRPEETVKICLDMLEKFKDA